MTDETESNLDGSLETEKDAGKGQQGLHKFWMLELAAADKRERDYHKEGTKIEERYEAEEADETVSHNILYSNVETMRPALYNSTPVPDIRRRFRDEDPVGKQVSQMLERASAHQMEINDVDGIMDEVILDHLLPGRGIARLNYEPTFQTIPEQRVPFNPGIFDATTGLPDIPENAVADEQGNIFLVTPEREVIVDERVNIIYHHWRNFRTSAARTWEDVWWVGFDWFLTQEQLNRMFPGKDVTLDAQTSESVHKDQDFEKVPSVFKRAYVREVWDKKRKRVLFLAPSFKEGPLRIDDDPLQLKDFFPCPKPLYSVKSRKSMIPVPDFKQYMNQAEELDLITKRIRGLIAALKYRGVYDATLTEMSTIMDLSDNQFTPMENAGQWRDAGGLDKAIWTMPIEEAAKVLRQLYLQRDQIKDTIFEITGLSDILRGVSDPNETLGAQQIKSQFGSLRIDKRQREVQRFVRDIVRIMVEIIAENFQPQTLEQITQMQVTPEMLQIMKSDQFRSYRIDIETDSTIARQIQDEEENYTKLLNAVGQFVQMVAPMVVQGFMPIEVAVSLLQSGIRRFKMGRSVEEAFQNIDIEQAKAQIQQQQQQGNPEAEAKQQELALKTKEMEQKLQFEAQKLLLKQKENEQKLAFEQQKIALDQQKMNADILLDRQKAGADLNIKRELGLEKINADKEPKTSVQFDTNGALDQTLAKVVQAMVQMNNANSENMAEAVQAISKATQEMSEAVEQLTKPKEIVFKNNRPVGIKVKENGQ